MNILEIQNLNAYFSQHQVLHNINLTVRQGKKLAIVGESGSGKTVLAQGIMQLNPLAKLTGCLKFQGQNLLTQSARQLQKLRGREIGMVFQEPMTALNPVMKIGYQITEVLTLHLGLSKKEAWQQAIQLLADTGIQEPEKKVHAYPFELSGGQRQRAMIAMAIAGEPKLLIADEPTTALDVAVQAQIINLLEKLQEEKKMTLIYISHDLNLVRRFADDVAVMRYGEIVEQGVAQDILTCPQHEYTKMLLGIGTKTLTTQQSKDSPTILNINQISVAVKEKKGLFKTNHKQLLAPISFSLQAGETLGIIGESGSGKTTLAKAIMKLMPSEGEISIEGQSPKAKLVNKIQMVFQDPFSAFNPRMNIFQIVSEPLKVQQPHLDTATLKQRVLDVLVQVGLDQDILDRYPHAFSGGQRQRLAIARAIIVQPSVLVLDEPTSALDVQWQQQILELLSHLQQQYQLSLILISHDLAVIRALSHRVIVLKDGQLIEQGTVESIFSKPDTDYTKKLLMYASL